MRVIIATAAAIVVSVAPSAAQTQWTTTRAGDIEFSARLFHQTDQIEQMLGDDLDKSYNLVEIKVRPLFDNKLELDRSDFTFRCRCNNERSEAQSPDRIAGSAVLALGEKKTKGGGVFTRQNDPLIIGGAPGTGSRPKRVGPPDGIGGATGGGKEIELRGETIDDDTLLGRLKGLELPLDPIDEPISGFLFFQVEPNRKLKHYVLSYDGTYGEFQMHFDK